MPYEQDIETQARARIYLQPIAAPSILGLYGFAGATFMVSANMVHWFGNESSALYLFPFAAMFGGLAQFLAGMWAYRARDAVATAMHGLWGSLWIAYGILNVIFAVGKIPPPAGSFPEIGYWFIVAAAITWVGAYASNAENKGFSTTLTLLALGSTTGAIGELTGTEWLMILTGYLFILSSIAAWYTASALMVNEAYGREVWRLGKSSISREMPPVSIGVGEPGVIRGQA
jgi:succinate-acetate transporter protein